MVKLQQSAPAGQTPDFKQILSALLLSMAMPGGAQASGAANPMTVIMPLLMGLLEQLTASQVADSTVDQAQAQENAAPVEARYITSSPTPHGRPIKGYITQYSHGNHIALDFGAPVGTPVKATMDGKVVYAGWNTQGYGNLVIIENGPYRTYYAHLSKIPVRVGQRVQAGEVIAKSGNTGNSTGPHLHYEIRHKNRQINPAPLTL